MGREPLLVLVAGKDPEDEPGGGHSSYVRAHALAAKAAGWHPIVLAVGPSDRHREEPYGTVHRVRSPYRPFRQLMVSGHRRVLARALVGLAGDRPVLAHAFGAWGAGAVDGVAALRASGRSAPAVAAISSYTTYRVEHESLVRGAVDEPWPARARYRAQATWAATVVDRAERDAYRRADRVWANYEAIRSLIHRCHGRDVRVDLIPYGPESAFSPLPPAAPIPAEVAALAPAEAPLVACVARHHSRKGVDVLIEALAELRDRATPFRAVLVGGGPLLAAHRHRVEHLGLAAQVAVPGMVPDVAPYLQAADLYVQPSREEQSGALALLEAWRLGLPVVATAVDGIPEDVTDGATGRLVAPGDPTALAGALGELLEDAATRDRLAAAGRRCFEERFAAAPFAAGLAAAYEDLGFVP